MKNNRKAKLETPVRSSLILTLENREKYELELEKWRKTVEPQIKAAETSQRITANDLSLTVTI